MSICPYTRNTIDGGIQSSCLGVDVWKIPKLQYSTKINTTVHDYPINPSISGVEDLLVTNNSWRIKKKRQRFEVENSTSNLIEFHKPPKKIFQKHHRALIVVVCKADGSWLDLDVSGKTPQQLGGKLNLPSILSANELSSSLQHFYCFEEDDYDSLCEAFPNGLILTEGQDYAEQIEEVLKQHSLSNCSLLSLDKIVLPEKTQSGRYHYFVRQFAGDGAPEVDKTFITSDEIHRLQDNYKMADAREYSEHPPLSIGFFQSFCHVIQISSLQMRLSLDGNQKRFNRLWGW